MAEFARKDFELDEIQADGQPLREHYRAFYRQTGEEHPEISNIKCPEPLLHIWDYFLEINGARTNNGFGPNPISYLEIDCWSRLMGIDLTPYEVSAIKLLDAEYLIYHANQSKKKAKR